MSKYSALIKRASNATAALALTMASLTPAVILGGNVKAAQITSRSIEMVSSAPNASTSWIVTVDDAYSAAAFTLEVCTSPLFDVTCANPEDGSTGSSTDDYSGTFGTTVTNGTVNATVSAINPSGVDGDNTPGDVGTFYVRITSGSDEGSVAMSTTNDLTINARVQEQLAFCVSSVDDANIDNSVNAAANDDFADCDDTEFSTAGVVDLGVVSSSAPSTSPVTNTTYSGNEDTGVFMIQTNAIGGAVVSYTSAGRLKIGSECADDISLVDQCFNSATNFTAWNAEKFGMTVGGTFKGSSRTGDGTSNLTRANAYNGSNYSWNNSSATAATIASSNTVLDWEFGILTFKARAAATTPTGSYTTSANFVATATF